MATTTETKRITHTLLEGNLLQDGSATREQVEQLAQTIADHIAKAFPGYEVEVPVQWHTSGAGPVTHTTDWEREDEIAERVNEIAGEAWQAWCESLPERA